MTFNSIDEYDEYIQQINDQHWEEMTMAGDKQEEFNEMMKVMNDEMEQDLIDNPHGPQTEVERGGPYLKTDPGAKSIMTPTDADVSEGWNRLRKGHIREQVTPREALHKQRREVKTLECMMETDAYLGYLAGAHVLAMMDGNHLLSGFYKGKYDKFIMDNTPK